eukprot:356780-Chlamydomonas_euryale.AAC.2
MTGNCPIQVPHAAYCSTLQHCAANCSTLQHCAAYCSTLQHCAARCSIVQHIAAAGPPLRHADDCDGHGMAWHETQATATRQATTRQATARQAMKTRQATAERKQHRRSGSSQPASQLPGPAGPFQCLLAAPRTFTDQALCPLGSHTLTAAFLPLLVPHAFLRTPFTPHTLESNHPHARRVPNLARARRGPLRQPCAACLPPHPTPKFSHPHAHVPEFGRAPKEPSAVPMRRSSASTPHICYPTPNV